MIYNYIAIEGNIGAGKTTLAKLIARRYHTQLYLESFAENPFLPKFYEDTERYAFSLELSFLADRYHQLRKIANENGRVVSDYFINKSLIFAQTTLDEDELNLFRELYNIMYQKLPKPELLIYLKQTGTQLKANIERRGRHYEQDISAEYLKSVDKAYMQYFKNHDEIPVLIVDLKNIDFVGEPDDFLYIMGLLEQSFDPGIHHLPE